MKLDKIEATIDFEEVERNIRRKSELKLRKFEKELNEQLITAELDAVERAIEQYQGKFDKEACDYFTELINKICSENHLYSTSISIFEKANNLSETIFEKYMNDMFKDLEIERTEHTVVDQKQVEQVQPVKSEPINLKNIPMPMLASQPVMYPFNQMYSPMYPYMNPLLKQQKMLEEQEAKDIKPVG